MTKRFIAILVASLLVFSAFLFTGCKKNNEDGNGNSEGSPESSAPANVESLSAKEVFGLALKTETQESVSVPTEIKDMKAEIDVDVNKLTVNGEDVTMGNPIGLDLGFALDADGKALEADASIELMGENPTVGAIVTGDAVYITDLLGINDGALGATFEELGLTEEAIDGALAESGLSAEMLSDMAGLGDVVANIVKTALDKHITDSAFTKETKDVTLNGNEIKGAVVATLTVTDEMAKALVTDIVTNLMANEVIASLLADSDINIEEITAEMDGVSMKMSVTVTSEGTVAGADAEMVIDGQTFAVKCVCIGGFDVKMGFLTESGEFDASQGVVFATYTLDEATGAEKLVVGVQEESETTDVTTLEGTFKDGKREGVITVVAEGEATVGIKYSAEGDISNGKVSISEISITSGGITQTIAVDIVVEYSVTETKASAKIKIAVALEGMADVDITVAVSVESAEVTVSAPESYTKFSEIDEATTTDWLTKITEKYPNIFSAISSLMMPEVDDDYYDDEFYYDDTSVEIVWDEDLDDYSIDWEEYEDIA